MLRVRAARGFTLLELMIVMVLLAVLGSISLPVYQGYITDTAADTFLAEVAEFERFYRIKAAEKNIDFCEVTWSDLDAGSADKVGYPSSSFMKVERIDTNLNGKRCGSDPVARSRAGGNQCDGLSLRVKAASETDGVEAVLVAQAVFNGIERQGMLKDWSLNTESIVVFTVNFRHGCEGALGQSQSSPTSVGAGKSSKAQSIPAKTVCSAPEQRLGDQCVTPVACVDGQLSADFASCNCPAGKTLYQGSCVKNASCGPGGALAADPSQCGQCGSGMGLVQGQCVTPVACVGGQLSADFASCNCPAGKTLYQGSCVKNASCGPGGALAADPSQCGQCGSGMGLVQGQCVTKVACVDGQLSADFASCNCPAGKTLYQGSCVQNASCGPGGALAADPSQCRQCGQGMHLNNGVCEQGKSRADCVRETTVKGNGRPHWSAVASCMGRSPSEWQAVRRGN